AGRRGRAHRVALMEVPSPQGARPGLSSHRPDGLTRRLFEERGLAAVRLRVIGWSLVDRLGLRALRLVEAAADELDEDVLQARLGLAQRDDVGTESAKCRH